MPLLHQDNSRGGGGPSDMSRSCQSLAEFLGLDTMLMEPVEASTAKNSCEEWSWETPGSPEVAQTPRALVPPGCFPPRHPRAFASFSESARPGAMLWSEESDDQGFQDMVSSLKALTLPVEGAGPALCVSPPPSSLHDHLVEPPWPPEGASVQLRNEKRPNLLSRRASFCGVVTAGRNGSSALRWSGVLPAREPDTDGGYSPKLFLGGLPWDITENALMYALRHFQPLCLEWPGRDTGSCMRGFAYVTLESERRVRALLAACRRDTGDWYYRLHARKCRTKEVQVIPWAVSDANWVNVRATRLEVGRTVFVGALHGMLSAATLAIIMNDLFSGVVYAGIDTDKNKYPIGSGRVTFNNLHSYVRAIAAAYIEIHTDKFTKKVQIDPYLEDSMCSVCNLQQGPYFCRQPSCFGYFCRSCWSWQHSTEDHRPLMRNSKSCLPVPPGHNGASIDHTAAHNGASNEHTANHNGPSNEHTANHNGHSHHSGTPSPPAMNGTVSGAGDGEPVGEDRDPWPQN